MNCSASFAVLMGLAKWDCGSHRRAGRNPPLPASAAQLSPLAYLAERRSCYRQADEEVEHNRAIAEQLVERLSGHFRQWRRLPSSPAHPIRLAFLVERECVSGFRSRVENIRKTSREDWVRRFRSLAAVQLRGGSFRVWPAGCRRPETHRAGAEHPGTATPLRPLAAWRRSALQ